MNRFSTARCRLAVMASLIGATLFQPVLAANPQGSLPPSTITAAKNAEAVKALPFTDRTDFESVTRGLVAPFKGKIRNAAGQVVIDLDSYAFLDTDKVSDAINPALWRLAQLNRNAGLFEVAPRIYQVRGIDAANMTIIEGDEGLFIIDPLTVTETSRAGLELYYQHRPRKPVVAVAYSHSHGDHFGGVRGVVDEADVRSGKVKIYAPAGFMEEAISEGVLAGTAMMRRAQFQYGVLLPHGELGQIDGGLGKGLPVHGTQTLLAPTVLIRNTFETHRIAGVQVEFQLTPGTEAPAEMNFFFPELRALCMSENTTPMMHNILTLRGALVRDPKAWATYIDASLERYGDKVDVMFVSHNWPTWGADRIRTMLADQRDMYAYLNNGTLNLINKGYTPAEISEKMDKLPGDLDRKWYTRGYYGSLSHNSRAVYQRYLGFYDGNPANLDPLPPTDAARRYVAAMGGADAVLRLMRGAMDKGDYRWAVQLGNHVVFADADNKAARDLQAAALEQLGYQTENATWRNAYLTAAMELRNGVPKYDMGATRLDMIQAMEPGLFFDYLAVRMNAGKAQGHDMTLNWVFEDSKQPFALTLHNGVLTYRRGELNPNAGVTVRLAKATLDEINLRRLDFPTAVSKGQIKLEGQGQKLGEFIGMLDTFDTQFNIVTP
ncbi:alkyl/aryl-sulfatase [Cupriavidus sp. M-11]|uniref:alkyl/aryl-sulfatase n=1 Tax=Cupriavidus sp. M-11 TaxID=3233038 RepID=UPI003F93DBDD